MIKMNFDNNLEGEDKHLIQLLRMELKEFPSDQLVGKTLTRISAMQAEKKPGYRPLMAPLCIMAIIALLLPAPFLFPMVSNTSLKSLPAFLTYAESSILLYAVWCWLAAVAVWISGLLFQVQSRFGLNPFKP